MTTTTLLDEQTIRIVKSTVPVLEAHGKKITKHFYQRLFENHPDLKSIFNQSNQRKGKQPEALANAVYAAAANIDNLEAILPAVKQIGHKHRSLNIQPEHYPIVGENLLKAIKEVLGDAATEEIINAWAKAYEVIADVFISVEKEMYNETMQIAGNWIGYRDFRVMNKVKESEVITSFYLKPEDGGMLPNYQPGQYTTVKVNIPGIPYTCQRHYSLSSKPNSEFLRISVKREDGVGDNPDGIVSTFLHEQVQIGDTLSLSAPAGFFVIDNSDKPLVLLSGGVGLTPLASMLEYAVEQQPTREVYFIHAAQNENVHAFDDMVKEISNRHKQVHYFKVYENTEQPELCDKTGYIDLPWLQSILPTNDASFYFCGPEGFMRAIYQSLILWDVQAESIHYEFFGPHGTLEN